MDSDNFHRIIAQPPVFNNENLLQFSIEPNKRYLVLGKTYLQYQIELEENFVPDNNFCSKVNIHHYAEIFP